MLVVVAGMNRSGSTWVYNAARFLMTHWGLRPAYAGWIHDIDLPDKLLLGPALIKVHEYHHDLALRADLVLTSHRDLRDVVASMARKFGVRPDIELATFILDEYLKWAVHAAYDLRYESLLEDAQRELARLASVMRPRGKPLDCRMLERITEELADLPNRPVHPGSSGADTVTLMHPGHVTDGRRGGWRSSIDEATADEIDHRFAVWMSERGYPPLASV
ncbi:MAG: hypothetical protein H6810_04270 [Phycisphaeraceae bacterium]|nr:MAG: hypothetical protein H6810_04270 [Phycisphaeraceae bacterium]